MAGITFGRNPPGNQTQGDSTGDQTQIIKADASFVSSIDGYVRRLQVYSEGALTMKLKCFIDDGSNYVFIAEGPVVTVAAGLNTFQYFCPWVKNGIPAYYKFGDTTQLDATTGGTNVIGYLAGDITTTTAKADWSNLDRNPELGYTVFTEKHFFIL